MSLGPFGADTIVYLALPEATVVIYGMTLLFTVKDTMTLVVLCCKIRPGT